MMATPSSTAITKRSADNALMPPPPPPSKRQKRPQRVLDEDVYHDAVSHIVARDFFPGLFESEAQRAYLEALDSNNEEWIRDAGRNLMEVMTPVPEGRRRGGRGTSFTPRRTMALGDTPRGFVGETPARLAPGATDDDFAPEASPKLDMNLSLGAFQAKYTSEDNESFNALLDKQNEKRARKYAFFQDGNKIPSARQIAHRTREQELVENGSASMALVTKNALGEERRAISFSGPSEDLDARPASVETFPNRQGPRNHFMFGPDGVEDYMETPAQEAAQRSNAPPKVIAYSATRFPIAVTTASTASVPPSPSMSAIDAAIAGRPKETTSETGYIGAETPRVNGYAFVDAEPTPSELGTPVADEDADAVERGAAAKLLPQVDPEGPNPFTIKDRSKREDLHHRLVEKADTARRKEKGGSRLDHLRNLGVTPGGKTPTPRFSTAPGAGSSAMRATMTPAAQRLAERIGTPKRESSGFSMSKAASSRNEWTTTPGERRVI